MKSCGHFNGWDRHGYILTLWLAFHKGLLLLLLPIFHSLLHLLLPIFHSLLHFLLLLVAFMKTSHVSATIMVTEMDKAIILASSCKFKVLDPWANSCTFVFAMCSRSLFEPKSSVVFESVSNALFFIVFS